MDINKITIDKELQDLVWFILPTEFKKNVKRLYKGFADEQYPSDSSYGYIGLLMKIFGVHNLTSDTVGEEMLHTDPRRVRELYKNYCTERNKEEVGTANGLSLGGRIAMLQELFGNKCLPVTGEIMQVNVGDKVVFHPFKSNIFYDATVLEIREDMDKPYLLHLVGAENIWAYPVEVQSIAETYPTNGRPCDNPLADKQGCRHKSYNGNCPFDSACYFEPQNDSEEQPDHIEVNNEMVRDSISDLEDERAKYWEEFCKEFGIPDDTSLTPDDDYNIDDMVDGFRYGFDSGYGLGLKASVHSGDLKATYESCCEEYRRRINDQWGLDIKDSWWIPSDRTGMTLALCDLEYSLSMEDVRLMVELGVSYEDFNEWWNHCLSGDPEDYHINAYNWFVNGCRPKDLE